MLKPLLHINAIKILDDYKTKGSAPLKIVGDDDNLYVAKFTDQRHPYRELINEVLCGYLAKCWNFTTPELAAISLHEHVRARFKFSARYKESHFENQFFGSQIIESTIDFDNYIKDVSKSEFREFENSLDLLRIGCFDHWIGNKDRKPDTSNILIEKNPSTSKFRFIPIDHTAAFAYFDYKEISDVKLQLNKSILECGFIRSLCKFEDRKAVENLHQEIKMCITNSLKELDFIFEQVPKAWGFSKKSKDKVQDFLSDDIRNKRISETYLHYLKK